MSLLNHLCNMPEHGNGIATKKELREILLQTGGTVLACGYLYDIVAKNLGAGVYRVSLKRVPEREGD